MARTNTKKSRTSSKKSKPNSRITALLFVLIIAVVGVAIVFAASAARKPSATGTISYFMVTDKNGDGMPNWGDTIDYRVTASSTVGIWEVTKCYRDGVMIGSTLLQYPSSDTKVTLWSAGWQSGGANCEAHLQGTDPKTLKLYDIAVQNFTVAP